MRVLELGSTPVVKAVYPNETFFVAAGRRAPNHDGMVDLNLAIDKIGQLRALVSDPSFDVIFAMRASNQGGTALTKLVRRLTSRRIVQAHAPVMGMIGDRVLRRAAVAPIIVFDPSDAPFVVRQTLWLWRRAAAIFKRELPLDRWQLFMRSVHSDVPTRRFRDLSRYRAIVDKLHPISLGIDPLRERDLPLATPSKQSDVFFAGELTLNSFVRETGMRELTALRAKGIIVDIPEERLARNAFYERCAQARLVWSPQGFGHDCFRHYEAAACGAVPLISRPTIEQYAPFREGETAFFYDPEPGGLTAAVMKALNGRYDLVAMGDAARSHARAFHTLKARVDHMLTEGLAL